MKLFVSYSYSSDNGNYGFGSCEILTNTELITMEIITKIKESIAKDNNVQNVIILFFREIS